MATAIFNADWNETTAQFSDPNLVVSPVNSRNAFSTLINIAHHTLLIEAEEMNDSDIQQALTNAVHQGVQVELKAPPAKARGVLGGASTLLLCPSWRGKAALVSLRTDFRADALRHEGCPCFGA